jgi:hypothetical protein
MNKITLNLGGKDREFHFGIGFIGLFLEKSGIQMAEIDTKIKENPFKLIPEMMYYSTLFADKRNNKEVDYDAYDMAEWIDEADGINGKEVIEFTTAFFQSLVKDVPTQPEVKKKVTKK